MQGEIGIRGSLAAGSSSAYSAIRRFNLTVPLQVFMLQRLVLPPIPDAVFGFVLRVISRVHAEIVLVRPS